MCTLIIENYALREGKRTPLESEEVICVVKNVNIV